jgi:uncharacterized metal-binding protein YceD (DUF177 family)
MAQKPQLAPEFSRVVSVEELEAGEEIRRSIEADDAERAALTERLGLLRLDGLMADVTLRRLSGGALVAAGGELTADLVQRCVVSLEPVPDHIEEPIEEVFAPEGYEPDEEEEEALPEYFNGREIDIGELVAQLLALALNPYPRAAGAEPLASVGGESDTPTGRRPFEGLAEMLKKQG